MMKLSDVAGGRLFWVQMKTGVRSFELRTEESDVIATLRFEKLGGTLATAEMSGESWTFKRVGFFNPRVTVRQSGLEENIAIYEPRFWGDGTLRSGDGREFEWKSTNFWSTEWAFLTSEGMAVFTFRPAREKKWKDIFKTQAMVDVENDGWREKNLGLLLSFGWYLVIMHEEEAATGAAAATCS